MGQETPENRDDRAIGRAKIGAIVEKIVALEATAALCENGELLFPLPTVLRALDIAVSNDDDPFHDEEHKLHRLFRSPYMAKVKLEHISFLQISLDAILKYLVPVSDVPEAIRYQEWVCGEFLPAIRRHGHHDPKSGHEPSLGEELDALERRERMRDILNALSPGYGDALASGGSSTPE